MPHALSSLRETPSQTAGPYVHLGLAPGAAGVAIYGSEPGSVVAGAGVPGERITIEGCVFDGTGAPVKDILIETWQADASGIYPHPEDPRHGQVAPGFRGWGRAVSDFSSGVWRLKTIKPGRTPGRSGRIQAPHISLWLVARGINIGLNTRLYFEDEAEANRADPVLTLIEQEHRRSTLLARRITNAGEPIYRFDICLQGENETVFFDI
jgi:protocatechuate 3,4-dioxygenase alpha subunit